MTTTCVIHVTVNGVGQVLGAVLGEPADVKGAIQQYQKAIGPLGNRSAFNDFIRQNPKFQLTACTPVDVGQV